MGAPSLKLSVVVMAHQKRAGYVPELLERLDREVEVVWDRRNDRWDTGSRAMLAHDPAADYHLVLQDDAVVPPDLLAGVERALRERPAVGDGKPVSLYLGRHSAFRHAVDAMGDDVSWVTINGLNWGVGIVMPTALIGECMKWCRPRHDVPNYDKRISRWLETKRMETWHTWPCLVNHRESPSLVPGRGYRGRVASRFVGEEVSALDVDWSGRVERITPWGSARVKVRRAGRQRGRTRG